MSSLLKLIGIYYAMLTLWIPIKDKDNQTKFVYWSCSMMGIFFPLGLALKGWGFEPGTSQVPSQYATNWAILAWIYCSKLQYRYIYKCQTKISSIIENLLLLHYVAFVNKQGTFNNLNPAIHPPQKLVQGFEVFSQTDSFWYKLYFYQPPEKQVLLFTLVTLTHFNLTHFERFPPTKLTKRNWPPKIGCY